MDNEELRIKYGKMSGIIGIILNTFLATSKLIIGLLSGMVSVVADSINNYSDAASSIISLIGFKLASRPADDEHPFGHARYEYISGLVVAFLVMIAGVELLKTGVDRILHPVETKISLVLFCVLVLSIVVKLLMAIINYRIGKKISSGVLLAVAADSRNDIIATAAILVSAIVMYFSGLNLDGIMSVLVALFVIYSGIGLVKDSIAPLLGEAPDEELVAKIEEKILSYDKVLGTHDLMVHDYGPGRCFASVHVEMPAEEDVLLCHEIIDQIEQDFMVNEKLHLVIHYDPIVTSDEAVGTIRSYLSEQIKSIHPKLTLHDLRIVPGEKNTNVIFDLVVPHECPISESDIKKQIATLLNEEFPDHTAVIKIDHSFVSMG